MPWENIQTVNEVELTQTDNKNDWKVQIISHGETLTGSRYYPKKTIKDAVDEGLYDNAKIYINHEFEDNIHRDMHDYAGTILPDTVNYVEELGTVEAIAHFHKGEALEMLNDDIARKNVGLSQSVYAKTYSSTINGKPMDIIEQIKKVGSVDIVPTGNAYGYFLENKKVEVKDMDITKLTLDELKVERPDLIKDITESVEIPVFDENSDEVKNLIETKVKEKMDDFRIELAKAEAEAKAKEMVNSSELPDAAKLRVIESLVEFDEESVKESIQKELDYIESLMPQKDEAEDVDEDIEVGIGQSESIELDEENKYEENFVEFLKKTGMDSETIKKLSKTI